MELPLDEGEKIISSLGEKKEYQLLLTDRRVYLTDKNSYRAIPLEHVTSVGYVQTESKWLKILAFVFLGFGALLFLVSLLPPSFAYYKLGLSFLWPLLGYKGTVFIIGIFFGAFYLAGRRKHLEIASPSSKMPYGHAWGGKSDEFVKALFAAQKGGEL
jgi:hypothetical protein